LIRSASLVLCAGMATGAVLGSAVPHGSRGERTTVYSFGRLQRDRYVRGGAANARLRAGGNWIGANSSFG
jgi:hypothetical protein